MDIIRYYCESPLCFNCMISFIGLLIGSFLNVIIYRLPIMIDPQIQKIHRTITLCRPRSFCPTCRVTIPAWLNVPVLSFLLLKGKTVCCERPISTQYLWVEASSAIVSFLLANQFGPSTKLLYALMLSWILLVLVFIDSNTLTLPNQITLPTLWLGLFVNDASVFVTLHEALLGAAGGYLFSSFIAWLFFKLRKTQGLGQGDFKLIAMLGAWFGWKLLPIILFIASLTGSLFAIVYLYNKKLKHTSQIPFAPFLALGSLAVILNPSIWPL